MFADGSCDECGQPISIPDEYIRRVQRNTHEWRMENWPSITVWEQFGGTIGELGEFIEILVKANNYDEGWEDRDRMKEEAGDVLIYWLGVLSLLDIDVIDCIEAAREKNDQRDWDSHQEAP